MIKTWLLYFVLVLPGGEMEVKKVGYFSKPLDCGVTANQVERLAFIHMKKSRPEIIALDASCMNIPAMAH